VSDGLELFKGWCSDSLSRRIRRDEFRELLLQRGQLVKETVIFGIGHFRLVQDIVQMVVPMNLISQDLNSACSFFVRVSHCPSLSQGSEA
jgi:hypothetical protein